eukprot:CAMPEP_0114584512 /NCGR_PEP_ID=MMETSP0125-20121206/8201_1 /TAXON_ID=485358 ORGANISM="Aristerostoma sp., Strain ATCC 50986" /NCGR_SAMPLE_ID=MMETSP0125 /ASSEMBLY_ACC=CAM_ASM_000245 /LENGTH=63 /DNA_ID=CAMNT_0001778955 /DNA_START=464 /DNA_END=655 /DNA_ORIENTATION=+
MFNPFLNAQDSLSSDSWEEGSNERLSSDDINSGGGAASDEEAFESPMRYKDYSPTIVLDPKKY